MFRKIIFCLTLIFGLAATVAAQEVDFDQVVQPLDSKARDFSEYLVQLAWLNSPESAIVQEEVKNAQDVNKNTRKEWMRDVQATFNLNESNLRSPDSSNNVFFPRYNFGVSLNLYNVVSQKDKNKIGKRNIDIARHKVNQRKLEIRAETLARFASFSLAREILKMRTLAEQDVYANYILIQQLYKTDEKTFEEYTLASSAYFEVQVTRIKAETEVQLAKYQLEEMLGIKWEKVLHPAKPE